MTKQEIIDAIAAMSAALDAIKGSSTNEEFFDAYRAAKLDIDHGAITLRRS